MRQEQQFVSLAHERLDQLRAAAEAAMHATIAQLSTGRQARVERDIGVAEHSASLAALNAAVTGLCFGRIDRRDGVTHHIGRIGIRQDDAERTPLLIDWRAPVARPFYLATGYEPMGLRRRRHITTQGRTVTDLHDEIMDLADTTRTGYESHDADEVLLAALTSARTGRMGDIVSTIQAEQDHIIRAPQRGVLVVEGGPGTGKTAVALHRAAYLLYADREQLAKRAVLIVGPNPAFLGYIGDVLPSLGETGVLLSTVAELFPGVHATGTDSPAAAAVKGRADMAGVLAEAVRDRQQVPEKGEPIVIAHDDGELILDWDMAVEARHKARETGLPHNLALPTFAFRIIDDLTTQLADRIGADPYGGPNFLGPDDIAQLGKGIAASAEVHAAITSLWPPLTPQEFLADYLEEPTHLAEDDAELLRRVRKAAWTPADVPLLDEAAELLGADDSAARAAAEAERARQIAYAQGVLDVSYASRTYEFEDKEDIDEDASEVLAAHDIIDAERFAERQEEADHRSAAERAAADRTWAFGHIIVDEAQELSAMAWRLLMRRSPTRSMTLVGDPAQTGDLAGCDSWQEILAPYVQDRWQLARLGVNYRTPAEIMEYAAERRRATDPAFEPPRSIRATGARPWERTLPLAEVAGLAEAETPAEGRLAVIAPRELHAQLTGLDDGPLDLHRPVVLLDPRQAKGLEFDTVLVVAPGLMTPNDLYVALTRATQRLGIITPASATPSPAAAE
ncbi:MULTISPECIES: ATP-binding domain-containing protein [unclassified Streptomyces]|uniref:HelD family protein n=1 Tax=unclassified Streptomyces TaxID=2593676 RepID=UPI002DDBE2AA|nr:MULTISPECIES: ATP-binding domain-containing protein [unclassified Streptomyces]WSC42335.1 AAA family ATPase [Streptomyces sp. NBC_01763]WSC50665.1 AAA family ATPase [Streptomyces sp. NBC_01762]WSC58815.1 AAA family ATPase [Streptomyces sp. NBC_01761]WSD30269.1 AAA family ATPase [Streptomyces sp. NBC_01751]WSJ56148.1 AAA family ATPase [Streptomyces sp. NBC_01318]